MSSKLASLKKNNFLNKKYEYKLSDNFILDEYISSRTNVIFKKKNNSIKKVIINNKNINIYNNYDYENCLFFTGFDENNNYWQINNIDQTKFKINDIENYIELCNNNVQITIFEIISSDFVKYAEQLNDVYFSIIDNDHLDNYNNCDIFVLNSNTNNKNNTYIIEHNITEKIPLIYEIAKITKENSVVLFGNITETDLIDINNTYYLSNCISFENNKYKSFVREGLLSIENENIININENNICDVINNKHIEIDNVWILINNYLRGTKYNLSLHYLFQRYIYYDCLNENKHINTKENYSRFVTRFLKPSNLKLFMFDNICNPNEYISDINKIKNIKHNITIKNNFTTCSDFFINNESYKLCANNLKKSLYIYNFCKMAKMFENNYVFSDVFINNTYKSGKYDWNIIIPYCNRFDNLNFLIKNIKHKISNKVNVLITVVELSCEQTLTKCDFYNEINYIWINRKKIGNHFNKCLCGNIAHTLQKDYYKYDYILWHDVDCVVKNTFVDEINKKINRYNTDLLTIHTFPCSLVLYTSQELANKIRNEEVDVNEIYSNTPGIKPPVQGAPGGSILITAKLFEKIGMFNTSIFYNHSPEDNFILLLVNKFGTYCTVDYNDNFMIHLWHPNNF